MTKNQMINHIKERYKRKFSRPTKKGYENIITHFGDCKIYSLGICNCGLITDLQWYQLQHLYKNYYQDKDKEYQVEEALSKINFNLKPYKEMTKEEKKEAEKEIRKMFKEINDGQ